MFKRQTQRNQTQMLSGYYKKNINRYNKYQLINIFSVHLKSKNSNKNESLWKLHVNICLFVIFGFGLLVNMYVVE